MTVNIETVLKYVSGELTDPLNPNKLDVNPTSVIYSGEFNGYTEERNALHEKIIADHIDGKRSTKEKRFTVVSGGMSMGATSMVRVLETQESMYDPESVVITPTAIAKLPEFEKRDHYQHPEKSPLLVAEYYHVVQRIIKAASERSLSVIVFEMGNSATEMLSALDSARSNNYSTAIVGLTAKEEGYFFSASSWQNRFGRISDHPRALGIMRDFSVNWQKYVLRFDNTFLVETEYKSEVQYVHMVAESAIGDNGIASVDIVNRDRYTQFRLKRHLNLDATTAEEARKDMPTASGQTPDSSHYELQSDLTDRDLQSVPRPTELGGILRNLFANNISEMFANASRSRILARRARGELLKALTNSSGPKL